MKLSSSPEMTTVVIWVPAVVVWAVTETLPLPSSSMQSSSRPPLSSAETLGAPATVTEPVTTSF